MNQLILEQDKKYLKKAIPQLKAGLTVRVHERIKEGEKFRTQIFEGLIIKVHNQKNVNTTFTVRKIVDGIGVEKIYLLHSPTLEKIEVIREAKIKQANLYYMRERSGKSARMKSKFVTSVVDEILEEEKVAVEEKNEEDSEAVEAQIAENTEVVELKTEETPEAPEAKTEETPEDTKAEENAKGKEEEKAKESDKPAEA